MKEVEILRNGGIILYPTDTIWGLGCDATNPLAIKKIISLKGRDETKSLLLLVKDIDMLKDYVESIPEAALELLKTNTSPLTIIYPKAKNLPIEYLSLSQSIGIRIPNHQYCQLLLKEFGKPIVSTSANISGEPSAMNFHSISNKIKEGVDFIAESEREKESSVLGSGIVLVKEDGQIIKIR